MTVWVVRAYVAIQGVGVAMREYWKRIAVGAFCGWLLTSVVGAFALVGFESWHLITPEDSAFLGAAVVWMGIAVGGMVAYVARPEPIESQTSER